MPIGLVNFIPEYFEVHIATMQDWRCQQFGGGGGTWNKENFYLVKKGGERGVAAHPSGLATS